MDRLHANLEIVDHILDYIKEHPNDTFGKVLKNLHIITYDMNPPVLVNDPSFEENEQILNRINRASVSR